MHHLHDTVTALIGNCITSVAVISTITSITFLSMRDNQCSTMFASVVFILHDIYFCLLFLTIAVIQLSR